MSNMQASHYLQAFSSKISAQNFVHYTERQITLSRQSWDPAWLIWKRKTWKISDMESLTWHMASRLSILHYEHFPEVGYVYNYTYQLLRPPPYQFPSPSKKLIKDKKKEKHQNNQQPTGCSTYPAYMRFNFKSLLQRTKLIVLIMDNPILKAGRHSPHQGFSRKNCQADAVTSMQDIVCGHRCQLSDNLECEYCQLQTEQSHYIDLQIKDRAYYLTKI